MLTNFRISAKTKHPACCNWRCCGNKFGVIARASRSSRIVKARRYAKHVERAIVKQEIYNQMMESTE